jgi:hypothetical protein
LIIHDAEKKNATVAETGTPVENSVLATKLDGPIFETAAPNQNEVSTTELDAFSTVCRSYLNWVKKVIDRSSFLKDGWFTSALVTQPMLELVHCNPTTLRHKYEFNRYASLHHLHR